MKRLTLAAMVAAFALSAYGGEARGAGLVVEPNGANRFQPGKVTTRVGLASFTWIWGGDGTSVRAHNVRQDRRLFRSGAPATEAPTPVGFNIGLPAGRFSYYCEVHGSPRGGMDGTVAVRPERGEPGAGAGPNDFQVIWANGLTPPGYRYDVRYRVGKRKWRTWLANTQLGVATFGFENDPVPSRAGRTYRFQVRPERIANPSRAGKWSPILKVRP